MKTSPTPIRSLLTCAAIACFGASASVASAYTNAAPPRTAVATAVHARTVTTGMTLREVRNSIGREDRFFFGTCDRNSATPWDAMILEYDAPGGRTDRLVFAVSGVDTVLARWDEPEKRIEDDRSHGAWAGAPASSTMETVSARAVATEPRHGAK